MSSMHPQSPWGPVPLSSLLRAPAEPSLELPGDTPLWQEPSTPKLAVAKGNSFSTSCQSCSRKCL